MDADDNEMGSFMDAIEAIRETNDTKGKAKKSAAKKRTRKPAPPPPSPFGDSFNDALMFNDNDNDMDGDSKMAMIKTKVTQYNKYWLRFGDALKKAGLKQQKFKPTTVKLDDICHAVEEVEGVLDGQMMGAGLIYAVIAAAKVLEKADRYTGLKLSGPLPLSDAISSNETAWKDLLDELAIKYGFGGMDVRWRIAVLAARTIASVHAMNTNPAMAAAMSAEVSAEKQKEFDDL